MLGVRALESLVDDKLVQECSCGAKVTFAKSMSWNINMVVLEWWFKHPCPNR